MLEILSMDYNVLQDSEEEIALTQGPLFELQNQRQAGFGLGNM